ncbi:receptor expression-enhancing protein 5 [Atheta coriaria]|uniref:receptor expression-enhancing protein 5 n=1 Tax=Dalotia coriaria TaxID=877792 RepID=UPI0031F42E04
MAQKVMELREHLDQSLRDETKPLGQIFGKLEAQTGVNRTYLFLGGIGITILWLAFGFAGQLVCNTIGFAYPAYVSIHAIETARADDDKKWLTYWVIFAIFSIFEFFVDLITRWIPLYWLLKCLFLVWLMIPTDFNGSIILYNSVVRPYFLKHKSAVDEAIDKGVKAASKLLNKDQ